MSLYLCASFQNQKIQSNHVNNINPIPMENILPTIWLGILKIVKFIKNKVLQNCQNQEELTKTWQINVMSSPRWHPETEKKGHKEKMKAIWISYELYSMYQHWLINWTHILYWCKLSITGKTIFDYMRTLFYSIFP